MGYCCEECDKIIKPNSKIKHFETNTYKQFNKCKHMELTNENSDINNVDEIFLCIPFSTQ